MKKYLKIFLCSLTVILGMSVTAKTKIALIGDSPQANQVADLVLVKLADFSGIEFLERAAIEKVLKEHKLQNNALSSKQLPVLAKVLHVDVFAVLSSALIGKKTVPSSLRIFDARNGFCLIDSALPDQLEKSAEFIATKLTNVIKILQDKQRLKFISILAVRNAGAPAKYKRQMAHIAIEIERRLIAMPDVAMLERSELGLVNRERKITDKLFKLAPSAYLLDLEFAPTSSADKIALKIYILNTSGKELKSFSFPDCLKITPEEIIKVLAKYLKTSLPIQIADAISEAKRFFEEYKYYNWLKKYKFARTKLASAIALDPHNPLYQCELINLIATAAAYQKLPLKNLAQAINTIYEILEMGDDIVKEFPEYNKRIYSLENSLLHAIYGIWNNRNKLTVSQKLALKKMAVQLRIRHFPEIKKLYWKYDLSNGINSLRELKNYEQYLWRSCRPWYYFDYDASIKRQFEAVVILMNAYEKYNQTHPRQGLRMLGIDPVFNESFFVAFMRQIKSRQALQAITMATDYPEKSAKRYAYVMGFLRKTAISNYDEGKFSRNLELMYKQIAALNYNKKFPNHYYIFDIFRYQKPNLYKIIEQKALQARIKSASPGSWAAMLKKLTIDNQYKRVDARARKIIEYGDELAKWRRCNNKDNRHDYSNTPARFLHGMGYIFNLSRARKPNADIKLCQQALAVLNQPISVRLVKKILYQRYRLFENAIDYNGTIFLLAKYNRNLAIFSFDPKNESVKKIGSYKNVLSKHPLRFRDFIMRPFFADQNYFVIGDVDRIIIVSRHTNSVKLIKNLPAENVRAVAVLNNQIYAFVGRKLQKNIFLSCLPDGSERKIHISTVRRNKQNYFDRQKYFTQSGLFVDKKKQSLIFAANGLWEFIPSSNTFKKLLDYNKPDYYLYATRIADTIYIASAGNYRDYYVYDMNSKSFDFVYFNNNKNRLKWLKNKQQKPRYAQLLNLYPPFIIVNDYLWSGGYGAILVDLKANNGMYCIYGLDSGMPRNHNILFFPSTNDHAVYAVTGQSIYKITPPNNSINQKEKLK